jgi:hypothetical protein
MDAWVVGVAVAASVALNAAMIWATQQWGWFGGEEERRMASVALKSEAAYARMETTIDVLTQQIQAKDDQIAQMRSSSAERDERINKLTQEIHRLKTIVADLTHQLQEKRVIEKPPKAMSILAIWPTAPGQPALDTAGESDALYNSGYLYTALRGQQANRVGVVLELDRVRPTIIQLGGHGTTEGILLSDGIAEPGWWGEVVAGKGVDLMVLLSCHSSQQDEINISDALIRVGVRAVVSCDDAIDDGAAVRFCEIMYAKLSEGLPLATAVRRAKLGVNRRNAEMIRLREGAL